ncbi:MAG: HAMP domain-containing sensor histidine kinase, partial [Polyangiaceae bacterium]
MKRTREAGMVLTLGFWMASTAAVVFLGGAHSPGVFIYLPIVIAAGLFWSWRAAAWLAAASFGAVTLAAWFAAIHLLPLPIRPISPARVVPIFAGSLAMTAVLVGIARNTMHGVLRDAQRAAAHAEERNERSRRLEAMGLIAGGIAHDFNNLLTVILSLGSVLNREIAADSPARELLVDMNASAVRAAALARELLATKSSNPAHVVDVGRALSAFEPVLGRMLGDEKMELSLRLPDRPCLVRMARGSLERIVTNLVMNARDAMPEGGDIVVAVAAPRDAEGPAANMVELSVCDTGTGIDPSLQPRIFEPFFTTKGASGTGLGLASVDDMVARLGGFIRVDSQP